MMRLDAGKTTKAVEQNRSVENVTKIFSMSSNVGG